MRRNDHDVTDKVRTTDLQQVSAEVLRLYHGLYNGTPSGAIERGFGRKPVFTREGGSIPVVSTFQEVLGLPSVLFGVGLPDENAHAPNEKLDVGNFHGGIIASAILYNEIADGARG